jgi:type IV fimbrial biogenesis protein FimT
LSWPRDQQGFTVLELLVVLTIVIILALITVPSFLSFNREFHVTAVGENLLYNLQYARSEAIKRNANVYVTFNTTDPWCYGISLTANCNCNSLGSCTLGAFKSATTQQTTMSTSGLTSNSLIFEGTRGATTNGKTTITFTVYGQTTAMSVETTALGNMQMCSPNIGGYPVCS